MYTADVENATCDCDVSLKLFGINHSSTDIIFKKQKGNFQKSVIDSFQCQFEDIGKIIKLRVTILPKFKNQTNQWCLEKIELYKENENKEIYIFQVNNWIRHETNYYIDIPLINQDLLTNYNIIIKTGHLSDSTCNSNVFIIISG